jgi:WD40 repeat protein
LASGSLDNSINLWSVKSKKSVAVLKGHSGYVYSVAFSGKYLASASEDKSIRVWCLAKWLEEVNLQEQGNLVTSIAFTADGKYMASG